MCCSNLILVKWGYLLDFWFGSADPIGRPSSTVPLNFRGLMKYTLSTLSKCFFLLVQWTISFSIIFFNVSFSTRMNKFPTVSPEPFSLPINDIFHYLIQISSPVVNGRCLVILSLRAEWPSCRPLFFHIKCIISSSSFVLFFFVWPDWFQHHI